MNAETVVLEFAVSADLCGLEALAHKLGPVAYGSGEVAAVDVVEFLWEGPDFFCVVDFEFDVGGDPGFSVSVVLDCVSGFCLELYIPCGLRGAEIRTENLRVWKIVAHFNGPNAGAGSDVQDCGGFVNGCQIELIAHGDFEHLMAEVETIEFAFIIWHDVASIFKCVISTTILDGVPLNAAGEGCCIP